MLRSSVAMVQAVGWYGEVRRKGKGHWKGEEGEGQMEMRGLASRSVERLATARLRRVPHAV